MPTFRHAVIIAIWIRVEIAGHRLYRISFSTFKAHAIPALVLEVIAQAAIRLPRKRVLWLIVLTELERTRLKVGGGVVSPDHLSCIKTKPPCKGVVDAAQVVVDSCGTRTHLGRWQAL